MRHIRFLLSLFTALTLAACEKTTHTVRYEVSGTSRDARVTYVNASGATEEQASVPLPWNLEFTAETLDWLHVRVFNATLSGTVSCKVLIDGKVFKEATSSGAWTTASCGGLLPVDPTPTPTP
jgi:hypothetical protein